MRGRLGNCSAWFGFTLEYFRTTGK